MPIMTQIPCCCSETQRENEIKNKKLDQGECAKKYQ